MERWRVWRGDGQISLREAIEAANTNQSVDGSTAGQPGNDAIVFAPALNGQPLVLTQGQLGISEPLFITGNGAAKTVIDAGFGVARTEYYVHSR